MTVTVIHCSNTAANLVIFFKTVNLIFLIDMNTDPLSTDDTCVQ